MKTGIIIPCNNKDKSFDITVFLNFIQKENDFHLCFVNDGSKNKSIDKLENIQSSYPHKTSIINIKKNSAKAAAVRAGAKYLQNRNDIRLVELPL
ncbi:glycosyltransferase [Aquimarina sediminis]|uniref:glycosyltransferase n=1 Tax=Aquimarina sediminis TaxID=2070536 RepID=UPI000CA089BE|nr:glycosyltransferase [Aquimarina sediminis]